jgi:hypothetical protein
MIVTLFRRALASRGESRTTNAVAFSPIASWLLQATLFWVAAAAAYSGFVAKWGLRDGVQRFGIERMLDGTAEKPFLYRQLIPLVANAAAAVTPLRVQDVVVARINPQVTFVRVTGADNDKYAFRYRVVCLTGFAGLLLSLCLLRTTLLDLGIGHAASFLASAAFALSFPYLQTVSGMSTTLSSWLSSVARSCSP